MIEVVSSENIKEILPLIRSYQAFYNVADINDSNNHEFFSQFGSDSDTGCLFGYRVGQQMVAFATVYFSFSSMQWNAVLELPGVLGVAPEECVPHVLASDKCFHRVVAQPYFWVKAAP